MNRRTLRGNVETAPAPLRLWGFRIMVAAALVALVNYCIWWTRIESLWLFLLLLPAGIATLLQLPAQWMLYLRAERRVEPGAEPPNLTVDVFVTACNEPFPLIEECLSAACAIRYPHRTWLLDDGNSPTLRDLAARLGAGYLTRSDRNHAKAGNLNAALARTDGEIILVFDIDHVPEPDFLDRALGPFSDPRIGFVQVMLTFGNGEESWVARAATEASLDFYNPTSFGIDDADSTTMMGSNSLIRREALASIGDYRSGLAEDLATSVALHAAGWRSAYISEPLAPGLVPADLAAWFIQQLKWSRGVFEVFITSFPGVARLLTWSQRMVYLLRMTSYWLGWVIALHLLATLLVTFVGSPADQLAYNDYALRLLTLLVIASAIRGFALATWHHPSTPVGTLWRGAALVYSTWPIYTFAWLMAITRVPLAFRPTPKGASGALNPLWMMPQIASVLLLLCAFIRMATQYGAPAIILLAFIACQAAPDMVTIVQWVQESLMRRSPAEASQI